MILRIKEIRFRLSKIDGTRTEEVLVEQLLPLHLGFLEFIGKRENYPYSELIYVKDIREDEITLIMLKENERLRETFHLELNEETIFYHKGPRGLPYGYNYSLSLEEKDGEK